MRSGRGVLRGMVNLEGSALTHLANRMGRRSVVGGLAAGGALAASGCAPVDVLNVTIPQSGLTIVRDIPYVSGPLAGDPRLTLDVYRPDALPGPLPVVVFIYGGAWRHGSKGDYLFAAAALSRAGNVVVVPDYRLFPQVRYPDFLADCAHAVVYARTVCSTWGGDPDRVFVVGHSAGAYNMAMLALDRRLLEAAGGSRDRSAGFVGLAGPYDFAPIQDRDAREVFGATADDPTGQPISYVDGGNRPMLLLAGVDDETVLPRNTTALAATIRARGGPVVSKVYPGVGHVGMVLALTPGFQNRAPVLADIEAFIATTPPLPSVS